MFDGHKLFVSCQEWIQTIVMVAALSSPCANMQSRIYHGDANEFLRGEKYETIISGYRSSCIAVLGSSLHVAVDALSEPRESSFVHYESCELKLVF